jgi:dTMP kinase
MGLIVAIEGGDGAGKATAAAEVVKALGQAGVTTATLAFPRYGDTVGGHVLGEFLSGRIPRLVSAEAAAVLYALDRLESRDATADLAARADVLVLDRYIASNMAYQAAKVAPAESAAMMRWILRMETDLFALPPPDLSVYLDTPLEVARELILRKRPRDYTDRHYDEHEADLELQRRVRENYAMMVADGLAGPWLHVSTVAEGTLRPVADIAGEIVRTVRAKLDQQGE